MLIPEFTFNRVKTMAPAIERIADESLDHVLAAGPSADLVSLHSRRIAALVIASILGVPAADEDFFEAVCGRLAAPSGTQEVFATYLELGTYLDKLLADPPPDLLARLVADEETLTRENIIQTAVMLLVAGLETTAGSIALSAVALLEHPEQLEAYRGLADTSGAADELLRFVSVIDAGPPRVATADFTLGDVEIKAGDGLIMGISLANRDRDVFEGDPDTLDVHRPAGRHLAFGFGHHQCLGHNLARLEVQIALDRLFARLPNLRLAVLVAELRSRAPVHLNGVLELPVTW